MVRDMATTERKKAFSKVLNNLICPRDHNSLIGLRCPRCRTQYLEKNGIFRFLPEIMDKGKIEEKERYDRLGSARDLEDLDPRGGFYPRRTLLNEARVSTTIESAHINNNDLILDVGCGSGLPTLSLMKKKNVYVVGLDLSDGALDFFRFRASEEEMSRRILLFQADAENIPFAANIFDRVISFSSIEHVPNPYKFIKECKRVCRLGGYFSVCTPNKRADSLRRTKPALLRVASIASSKGPSAREISGLPHSPYHKEFTDKELRVLFEKSGLKEITSSFLTYLPTGIPDPLGNLLATRPIAYLESFLAKVPYVRNFSSLITVSGRKTE
jgi:ubiquinone/menaquinone biosynthesis C-methylase UbiE